MRLRAQKGTTMKTIQYRVRPITRFVVTRYEEDGNTGGSSTRGTYDNAQVAFEVAYALCKAEHDASGQPIDSMGFIYPREIKTGAIGHASDCAINDAPAYSPGDCDCSAAG